MAIDRKYENGMTVRQFVQELAAYYGDRKIEIQGEGIPTRVTWDGDRRCVTVETAPAPILDEPYTYVLDEEE